MSNQHKKPYIHYLLFYHDEIAKRTLNAALNDIYKWNKVTDTALPTEELYVSYYQLTSKFF